MRLFVAIPLEKEIKEHLIQLQQHIGSSDAKVAWVAKKNLHLTLKYLGNIKDPKKIQEALKKIKTKKIQVHLGTFETIPKKEPRVLYVSVEPAEELKKLAFKVDEQTMHIPADHAFLSHITIGRIKQMKFPKDFKKKVESLQVQQLSFTVDKFQLMTSQPKASGPVYKVLEEYRLE